MNNKFTSGFHRRINMLNKILLSLSLASLLFVPMMSQAATYYRWVDDNKVTHYTMDIPEGREYEIVKTIGGKGISPPPASHPSDKVTNSSTQTQPTASKPKKDPAVCEKARANLKTLQEHARIRQKNEYGEEVLLSEEEKDAEIQRAKKAVNTYC